MGKETLSANIIRGKKELELLLVDVKREVYDDAVIYFVDNDKLKKIISLRDEIAIFFNNSKLKRKSKDPFFQIAKIINEDNKAIAYKFYMKYKYKNIVDKEKIENRIESLHLIEVNKITKKYREERENKKNNNIPTNDKLASELKIKEEKEIARVVSKKSFLLENFSELDIRITTFREKKKYPTIKLLDIEKKDIVDYLRIEAPNIVLAHDNIFELVDGYRRNSDHITFVLDAKHAFGEIYYKLNRDI